MNKKKRWNPIPLLSFCLWIHVVRERRPRYRNIKRKNLKNGELSNVMSFLFSYFFLFILNTELSYIINTLYIHIEIQVSISFFSFMHFLFHKLVYQMWVPVCLKKSEGTVFLFSFFLIGFLGENESLRDWREAEEVDRVSGWIMCVFREHQLSLTTHGMRGRSLSENF